MPDIHAGSGSVIGTTVELGDKVIPNVIGVDIGCGMLSCKIDIKNIDFKSLDEYINKNIPSGFSINNSIKSMNLVLMQDIIDTCEDIHLDTDRVLKSIGTLGGGNHFIEVGKDEEGFLWITIHSGSRNFGLQIAKYHQKKAEGLTRKGFYDIKSIPPKDRQNFKSALKSKNDNAPKGMEYLIGESATLYFKHMKVAQRYASTNRDIMMLGILEFLNCQTLEDIESVHNYIDFYDNVIRKGAISAKENELVVIPWNMRDGLIIGKGKGNPDWNFSAPHGAGRNMSRTKAKENIRLEEFQESMKGIYSSSIVPSTIDESPMAYKDHKEVEKYLSESVDIIHRVKPEYSFKDVK